jgi:uncharacterized protein (DUF697 family)
LFGNWYAKATSYLRGRFSHQDREAAVLEQVRRRAPVPVLWLFGKTQAGKTSLIKYLTGEERAEIGKGYRPCTRFSSEYHFPDAAAPLLTFLDTRGLEEPGYDPAEDLARFNEAAHVVLATVRVMDHAQEGVVRQLQTLRRAQPRRPIILVLTCLHEAYPQEQHAQPYSFQEALPGLDAPPIASALQRCLEEQKRRFDGLYDHAVAIDLTPPEEGFTDPEYGGPELRNVLLNVLPDALGQTLRKLDQVQRELQDIHSRQALPVILGYSSLAATAGALPVPFVDLVVVSAIQTRLVYRLAGLSGRPLARENLKELASALGLGLLAREARRSLIKMIPGLGTILGSVAGGAWAGATTFALGKAFCLYYQEIHDGHQPSKARLKELFNEQLSMAIKFWAKPQPTKEIPATLSR